MKSTTARVFEEDIERARLIGAVQAQSAQEVLHAALMEYVGNHRDELAGLFRSVQQAVLNGDREALRASLVAGGASQAAAEHRSVADAWGADE